MARSKIRASAVLDPAEILDNLINDYINGDLGGDQVLHRVLVTKIDFVGGELEKESDGRVPNPKNSIQGRLTTGRC